MILNWKEFIFYFALSASQSVSWYNTLRHESTIKPYRKLCGGWGCHNVAWRQTRKNTEVARKILKFFIFPKVSLIWHSPSISLTNLKIKSKEKFELWWLQTLLISNYHRAKLKIIALILPHYQGKLLASGYHYKLLYLNVMQAAVYSDIFLIKGRRFVP